MIYVCSGLVIVLIFMVAWVINRMDKIEQSVCYNPHQKDFYAVNVRIDSLRREISCPGHKLTFVEKYEIDLSESAGIIKTIYRFKCILCDTRIDKTESYLSKEDRGILYTLGITDENGVLMRKEANG